MGRMQLPCPLPQITQSNCILCVIRKINPIPELY